MTVLKWVVGGPLLSAWAGVVCLTAVILCQTPLFNLLGFEFSFALGIPLSLFAGFAGIGRARGAHGRLWKAWLETGLQTFALSCVPLALISLNALRVQNCNYLEGLAHFAIIPLSGALVSGGWGVLLGHLVGRRAGWCFIALWCASILRCFLQFWLEPQIDLFNSFLGYFPGALYDEVLLIDGRILASRAEDIAWVSAALAVAAWREKAWRGPLLGRGVVALTLTAALSIHALASHVGVHRDAAFIQDALGGHHQSTHFQIYYPKSWKPEKVEVLATELEFLYTELVDFLKTKTRKPISAYLYPNAATKKRLMGARRTRIAKPWQWSFHVDKPHVGQDVMLHEMAHAFSGEFASGPHHLSLTPYGLPNMALIEGLAEAATWPSRGLDLHQWSAALQKIEVAPRVDTLLNPTRFYARPSRMVYTLCGSFARHIQETEGLNVLLRAYGDGYFADGAEFSRIHEAWLHRLEALPLPANALNHARARFDRPAIFGKVCAREIAALRREMGVATVGGRYGEALEWNDRILGFIPGDINARLRRIPLLFHLGRLPDAEAVANDLAADKKSGAVARAKAQEWVADLAALSGRLGAAEAGYEALVQHVFTRESRRRLAVKRAAMAMDSGGDQVIDYLRRRRNRKARLKALGTLSGTQPDWVLLPYLRARTQLGSPAAGQGIATLKQWNRWSRWPSIRMEAQRLIARAAFSKGCYTAAAQRFAALANDSKSGLNSSERFALLRWQRRAKFFQDQRGDVAECKLYVDNPPPASEDSAQTGNVSPQPTVDPLDDPPIGGALP